jgi:DNA-binding transcriptional regulator YdaS (Cro superfamily)
MVRLGNVFNKIVIKMKKILVLIIVSNFAFAQIAIGKTTVTGSGLLEFNSGTTKGIILPNVLDSSTMTPVTVGTLVFDRTTAKVQYYDGAWKDLTLLAGTAPSRLSGADNASATTIMGSRTSSAAGVLVLESATKALILPQITNPAVNVKSPYAGMICYDPTTKTFCVYNGTDWYYWK